MNYFPIYINTEKLRILLIGAGNIGFRRTKTLLPFFDSITVISREFKDEFFHLPKDRLHFIRKEAEEDDLTNFNTVIACTNDTDLNYSIYKWSVKRNKLVNICDRPDLCSFYFPSIIKERDTIIGICSNGDKRITKRIRKILEIIFENEVIYDS